MFTVIIQFHSHVLSRAKSESFWWATGQSNLAACTLANADLLTDRLSDGLTV